MEPVGTQTARLGEYLADAASLPLSDQVRERGTLHLLDTLAAIVSGAALPAGIAARSWASRVFGTAAEGPCTIVGWRPSIAYAAAVCNGMAAHADETDDSHMETLSHPGCGIVPAALAAAEEDDASGADLLSAVVAGYDIGCRVGRAVRLFRNELRLGQRSSHALVGAFGAAAAAAVLHRLKPTEVRYVLSYTAQLCSGVTTWMRDTNHIEKAYVFAGMPASQGIQAVSLVAAGCTGVEDVFGGKPNWLEAVSSEPNPSALVEGLGTDFEVLRGTLKKYSVGSPAQAAVEAIVEMINEEGLSAKGVQQITIELPSDSAVIVDQREMPSINVQYLVAGTLIDGGFSFGMAHDAARMSDPTVSELLGCTKLVRNDSIRGTRDAVVTVETNTDGNTIVHRRHIGHVYGTAARPMSVSDVRAKAIDLMGPTLGDAAAEQLADRMIELESVRSIRELLSAVRSGAGV